MVFSIRNIVLCAVYIHEQDGEETREGRKGAETGESRCLDESLLFFASKATEAIEAFAFAVTVVKTTVGATGKLGEVAKVVVVVDLFDHGICGAIINARRHGVGTSTSGVEIDSEEVLNASLAGCVREFDNEVNPRIVGRRTCQVLIAEVGGTSGVFVVAVGGL